MTQGFKDHFSTRSADYAKFRPVYPPELADYLAGLTGQHRQALDCGCGTGQLSTLLADHYDHVLAIDASAQQLEKAQKHTRVEYRQATAEKIDLADDSVDLITVAQAAHWFDLDPFYAQVRRVLRPDGAIALISYGVVEADGDVGRTLATFYFDVLGTYWSPERRHVETGYRSLPFPFREAVAPRLDMRASWTLAELLGYVDTWSAVRNAEAELGRECYEQFAGELAQVWGRPEQRREIRWPLSMRAGHP